MRSLAPAGRWVIVGALVLSSAACDSPSDSQHTLNPLPEVAINPGKGGLVRLTEAQLAQSLKALFGAQIQVGGPVEPDVQAGGLLQVGAARAVVSNWGVEQYEALALDVAAQAVAEGSRTWMPCTPAGRQDMDCYRQILHVVARQAFRRSPQASELAPLLNLAAQAAEVTGDPFEGLSYALSAILQSPEFLYRRELGEGPAEPSGLRNLSGEELATRLAFFLWDGPPDEELLAAAMNGELSASEGLRLQAERMMGSPRFSTGMRAIFEDFYQLYALSSVSKDPTLFVHFSSELGGEAHEETLLFLEDLLLTRKGDMRDVFTERRSFVSRRLAALYGIPASARDGHGPVQYGRADGRRGLLGQASFLMLNAHPVSSSATLRGKFIREVYLCGTIPPPPAGVNTALPEPSGTSVTLRDRVAEHLENPSCAQCHQLMDPIGLGLEQFDGVGRFRAREGGQPIDPRGELDGVRFQDAWSLAEALHDHPDVPRCFVRTLYRYAVSREEEPGETELLALLEDRFGAGGFRLAPLLLDIIVSPGFRKVSR